MSATGDPLNTDDRFTAGHGKPLQTNRWTASGEVVPDNAGMRLTITFACTVCRKQQSLDYQGATRWEPGPWRHVPSPFHGHDHPLSSERVTLCSRECAEEFFASYVECEWGDTRSELSVGRPDIQMVEWAKWDKT